jgi:thiol:disulfide interchange protein DsbD
MGLTMGLLAAPCVGPVLAGLILAVGARQDVAFGASVFFTLSLGLGAPYLLLATLAGTVRRLPRSGGWLAWMEHLLGVVLVGLALFYVEPLIPHVLRPIAWAALLASGGVYLGFVDPSGGDWPRFAHLKRAVGVVALAGAAWGFGGASSASPIRWEPLTAESLGVARNRAAPAVVDFTAEWCIPCREMDTTTFQDAEVIGVARGFAMLRADVTVIDDQTDALMREQRVLGVPTYLFFTAAGLEAARLVGYVAPAEFLRAMRAAAAAG